MLRTPRASCGHVVSKSFGKKMKPITYFGLLVLILCGCAPSKTDTSFPLTYPENNILQPSDIGIDKTKIEIDNAFGALEAELLVTKDGHPQEHRIYIEFQARKTSMLIIQGTPIWGSDYILRSNFGLSITEMKSELSSISNDKNLAKYELTVEFYDPSGSRKIYKLIIRKISMDEIKRDPRIDPKLYERNGSWGTSFSVN